MGSRKSIKWKTFFPFLSRQKIHLGCWLINIFPNATLAMSQCYKRVFWEILLNAVRKFDLTLLQETFEPVKQKKMKWNLSFPSLDDVMKL